MGGGIGGAKRYVFLLGAIIGFFAISWRSTPAQKAYKYGSAYFLGGMTSAVGNLLPFVNPAFYFIFSIFPPELSGLEAIGVVRESDVARFGGLTFMANALFCVLLARYGIRGVFDFSGPLRFLPFSLHKGLDIAKPWRFIFFLLALVLSLFGGFRSILLIFAMIFALQFFYENLFSTKLFPTLMLAGVLAACLILPFANQLPLAVQRAISFLPVSIDPVAKGDAASSTEWRLTIWKRVMPEVPRYFLLGKGFAVPSRDLEMMAGSSVSTSQSIEIAILAGDYHNGPLSLIIPLGIWGVIGFIWFLLASFNVLRQNYRFGSEHLKNLNRFLLVYFLAKTIFFFLFFGSFYTDLFQFTGLVGLSVSLNHGVSKRAVTRKPDQMPTIV
ncbi:MAG: O-antigen ligase family protein [Verrucomicrobiota bacterium]